jgi:hypothetical protein
MKETVQKKLVPSKKRLKKEVPVDESEETQVMLHL